jgi:hypothetical protein
MAYYLSLDGTKSADDTLLTESRPVESLAVGAMSTGTVTVTIPAMSLGTYVLLSCADGTALLAESNEANNCLASTTAVEIVAELTFPTVAAVSGGSDSGGTSHSVQLPPIIAAGDLLIVHFLTNSAPAVTFPAGWQNLVDHAHATQLRSVTKYRIADGSEGSTISVLTATSQRTSHTVFRITGFDDGTPVEAGLPAIGSNQTPDPSSTTPSGGAKEYLWIAVGGSDNSGVAPVSGPADYSSYRIDPVGTNSRVRSQTAWRELNASSEDPGPFDSGEAQRWIAYTLAIHPQP